MKKTIIILPAYNEEKTISSVLQQVRNSEKDSDVLVINDGSHDRTASIAKELGVMVINHPYNLGYAAALQTGYRFAAARHYEYIVIMDADGQHDSASIAKLFDRLEKTGADVVIGSRFLEGGYVMGSMRRIGVWLFSKIAKLYTGMILTDPTSGFQLLNRKAFCFLADDDDFPIDYPDVNIIMLLHKRRFSVVEAPVRMFKNTKKNTMHGGMKPIVYIIRMLLAITLVLLRRED